MAERLGQGDRRVFLALIATSVPAYVFHVTLVGARMCQRIRMGSIRCIVKK